MAFSFYRNSGFAGVDTRLVNALEAAAQATGYNYSLVGPYQSGIRTQAQAEANAKAGAGVVDSAHVPDKNGVGHAADIQIINPQTGAVTSPNRAFLNAMQKYAAQNGFTVRAGADFSKSDPNHVDLGPLKQVAGTGVAYSGVPNMSVRQVQQALQQVGLYNGAIDGIAGQGTLTAIRAAPQSVMAQIAQGTQPSRLPAVSIPNPNAPGGSSTRPGLLQTFFNAESYGGRNVPNVTDPGPGAGGGYFQIKDATWARYARQAGVDTSAYPTALKAPYAVQAQVAAAIPMGQWGPRTLNLIRSAGYNLDLGKTLGENLSANGESISDTGGPVAAYANQPQQTAAQQAANAQAGGARTLQRGAQGQDVGALQQALIDRGYNVGPEGADRKYGLGTARAVSSFERVNRAADPSFQVEKVGVAGPQVLGKLGLLPGGPPRTGIEPINYVVDPRLGPLAGAAPPSGAPSPAAAMPPLTGPTTPSALYQPPAAPGAPAAASAAPPSPSGGPQPRLRIPAMPAAANPAEAFTSPARLQNVAGSEGAAVRPTTAAARAAAVLPPNLPIARAAGGAAAPSGGPPAAAPAAATPPAAVSPSVGYPGAGKPLPFVAGGSVNVPLPRARPVTPGGPPYGPGTPLSDAAKPSPPQSIAQYFKSLETTPPPAPGDARQPARVPLPTDTAMAFPSGPANYFRSLPSTPPGGTFNQPARPITPLPPPQPTTPSALYRPLSAQDAAMMRSLPDQNIPTNIAKAGRQIGDYAREVGTGWGNIANALFGSGGPPGAAAAPATTPDRSAITIGPAVAPGGVVAPGTSPSAYWGNLGGPPQQQSMNAPVAAQTAALLTPAYNPKPFAGQHDVPPGQQLQGVPGAEAARRFPPLVGPPPAPPQEVVVPRPRPVGPDLNPLMDPSRTAPEWNPNMGPLNDPNRPPPKYLEASYSGGPPQQQSMNARAAGQVAGLGDIGQPSSLSNYLLAPSTPQPQPGDVSGSRAGAAATIPRRGSAGLGGVPARDPYAEWLNANPQDWATPDPFMTPTLPGGAANPRYLPSEFKKGQALGPNDVGYPFPTSDPRDTAYPRPGDPVGGTPISLNDPRAADQVAGPAGIFAAPNYRPLTPGRYVPISPAAIDQGTIDESTGGRVGERGPIAGRPAEILQASPMGDINSGLPRDEPAWAPFFQGPNTSPSGFGGFNGVYPAPRPASLLQQLPDINYTSDPNVRTIDQGNINGARRPVDSPLYRPIVSADPGTRMAMLGPLPNPAADEFGGANRLPSVAQPPGYGRIPFPQGGFIPVRPPEDVPLSPQPGDIPAMPDPVLQFFNRRLGWPIGDQPGGPPSGQPEWMNRAMTPALPSGGPMVAGPAFPASSPTAYTPTPSQYRTTAGLGNLAANRTGAMVPSDLTAVPPSDQVAPFSQFAPGAQVSNFLTDPTAMGLDLRGPADVGSYQPAAVTRGYTTGPPSIDPTAAAQRTNPLPTSHLVPHPAYTPGQVGGMIGAGAGSLFGPLGGLMGYLFGSTAGGGAAGVGTPYTGARAANYTQTGMTPWGSPAYGPGGSYNSPFTPATGGYAAPSFNAVSGGPTYSIAFDPATQQGSFINSAGNVVHYQANDRFSAGP